MPGGKFRVNLWCVKKLYKGGEKVVNVIKWTTTIVIGPTL